MYLSLSLSSIHPSIQEGGWISGPNKDFFQYFLLCFLLNLYLKCFLSFHVQTLMFKKLSFTAVVHCCTVPYLCHLGSEIDDHHRHPNINAEIIQWATNYSRSCLSVDLFPDFPFMDGYQQVARHVQIFCLISHHSLNAFSMNIEMIDIPIPGGTMLWESGNPFLPKRILLWITLFFLLQWMGLLLDLILAKAFIIMGF